MLLSESMSGAGRPVEWRADPLLSGLHQAGQFSSSGIDSGPWAFIESPVHGRNRTEGAGPLAAGASALVFKPAGEPGSSALAAEAPCDPQRDSQRDSQGNSQGTSQGEAELRGEPQWCEASGPQEAEPASEAESEPETGPDPVAEFAPQPPAEVRVVVDEQALRREYDAGFEAGLAAASEQSRQDMERERAVIKEMLAAISRSVADTRQFFAPMERLAVHLAEQLVRGELTLSGQAIRRLVENCLLEFEHRGERVVLKLHPEDMEKFTSLEGELSDNVELVRDAGLGRGSVRIEMADGVIEDLIEHRLEALARSVLGDDADVHPVREAVRETAGQRPFRRYGQHTNPDAGDGDEGASGYSAPDAFRDHVIEGSRAP